jgi:hypothetical protein
MTLYSLFWGSQKENGTGLVVLSAFLTAAWLALFAAAAHKFYAANAMTHYS